MKKAMATIEATQKATGTVELSTPQLRQAVDDTQGCDQDLFSQDRDQDQDLSWQDRDQDQDLSWQDRDQDQDLSFSKLRSRQRHSHHFCIALAYYIIQC